MKINTFIIQLFKILSKNLKNKIRRTLIICFKKIAANQTIQKQRITKKISVFNQTIMNKKNKQINRAKDKIKIMKITVIH